MLLLLSLLSSPAQAAHRVALLLDPAQLSAPRAELTADLRVADRTSVAGVLGVDLSSPLGAHHYGAQLRQGFTGSWERGAWLAAEVVTGSAGFMHRDDRGVSFGGLVGGRYVFSPPLTLDAGIGGHLQLIGGKLYPGATVNIGLGWTF